MTLYHKKNGHTTLILRPSICAYDQCLFTLFISISLAGVLMIMERQLMGPISWHRSFFYFYILFAATYQLLSLTCHLFDKVTNNLPFSSSFCNRLHLLMVSLLVAKDMAVFLWLHLEMVDISKTTATLMVMQTPFTQLQ